MKLLEQASFDEVRAQYVKLGGVTPEAVEADRDLVVEQRDVAERGVMSLRVELEAARAEVLRLTAERDEALKLAAADNDKLRARVAMLSSLLSSAHDAARVDGTMTPAWVAAKNAAIAETADVDAWLAEQRRDAFDEGAREIFLDFKAALDGEGDRTKNITGLVAEHDAKMRAAALEPLAKAMEAVKSRGWTWTKDRYTDLGERLWDLAARALATKPKPEGSVAL